MANKSVLFKIKRQATPTSEPYWEEFELAWRAWLERDLAVHGDRDNPVTRDGKPTTPINYDSNCLEEVCGSCAMLINGKARMACSALVDNLEQPLTIEPFSKFPVIRDLQVDRICSVRESEGHQGLGSHRRNLRTRAMARGFCPRCRSRPISSRNA